MILESLASLHSRHRLRSCLGVEADVLFEMECEYRERCVATVQASLNARLLYVRVSMSLQCVATGQLRWCLEVILFERPDV